MTFLNPFILFGLAAASIPIIIHLFNIRKLRTIEFSTLTFLKELNKQKIRKIKIRQWLLLALRTLLILIIVLAFSRPALKGTFSTTGARASSTIVILMDNSASMQLHNERGTFLTQGQQRAKEIAATMQENDEGFFLRLSDLPDATMEEPSRDPNTLAELIEETEISNRYRTIEEGLRPASRLLQQSKNFNKEIHIITDGQTSSLMTDAKTALQGEQLFEPSVKVFFTQLSTRPQENIGIERTVLPPALLQVNKAFPLHVVVKNYGSSPVRNHLVTITLDRKTVMQKSVSLDGGERTTLDFMLVPNRTGFLTGFAESEDDEYEPDNRSYFSVAIPEKISVTLIAPEEKYSRYVFAALKAAQAVYASSPVIITPSTPSNISSTLLSKTDVLLFSGVKEIPSSTAAMVQQFVVGGGTVFFFPSADTNGISYRYLDPLGIRTISLSRSSKTFGKVDLQFPLFQGMFEQTKKEKNPSIESPQINLSVHASSEANLRSIIAQTDGKNFLWLRDVGRGKIIGVSVPATTEWSDFPLKALFVPLLYQSVLYLASPVNTAERQLYFSWEPVEFSSTALKKGIPITTSTLKVYDTEKRNIPVTSYSTTSHDGPGRTIYSFHSPDQAGVYPVMVNNDTVLTLPVNVRSEESICELAGDEERQTLMKRLSINENALMLLGPDSNVEQTISESRYGIELWKYFLLAAVIIALIEMIVAREPKQSVHP